MLTQTRFQGLSNKTLLIRTRPYRNDRIISVIRSLYFMGGVKSFASRFASRFPMHPDANGVLTREVPNSMVSLVSTAVRLSHYVKRCTNFASSCMLRCMSGERVLTKSWNFRPMPSLMCMKVTLTHSGMSGRIVKVHITS